eukprot:CAMPEP_0184695542 /NCGR_PEP_ID=MMETSP0313-20130426/3140_1 /TAXON_ID=2792 /ORGANISM="Porphyridium aerugineum, Strain SAG 1380-2" /LENGTH=679 /DNA_ID=CAMNT_0027154023 /DNA_START=224 /DNA_END=2263 /DNA_ORIENTATION=-
MLNIKSVGRRPPAGSAFILILTFILMLWTSSSSALYLPGIVPTDYEQGAEIEVLVSKLTSNRNKVPYGFYSLPICTPADAQRLHDGSIKPKHFNLGQVLLGEREFPSPFKFNMNVDQECEVVCSSSVEAIQATRLRRRIFERYYMKMSLDGMPLVSEELLVHSGPNGPLKQVRGMPVGVTIARFNGTTGKPHWSEMSTFLNTHFSFKVLINKPALSVSDSLSLTESMYRVVGFRGEAKSHDYSDADGNMTLSPEKIKEKCLAFTSNSLNRKYLEVKKGVPFKVTYTYSVRFEHSEITWATRWDTVLRVSPHQRELQLMALGNSLLLGLLLTGALALIVLRTLRRDLKRYADQDLGDETMFETGWKLVAGDVFRQPERWPVLVILCATGVQLAVLTLITLILAAIGFLSPVHRGALLTGLVLLFPLSGAFAGYVTSRMVKLFGATTWKGLALGTSLAYPSVVFVVFMITNFLLWTRNSISTTPLITIIGLLFLWLGISCPLVFLGAKIGFDGKPINLPTRVNQVPRQIPLSSGFLGGPLYLLAGAMPFGVICVELLFVLNSIWQNEYYLMFGMLTLIYVLLIVTTAETSVAVVYLKLILEDYRWWWPSFYASASAGIFVFLYSLYYYISLGHDQFLFVSTVLYVSYMFLISCSFSLLVGSIGTFASLFFVTKIYEAVRSD